MREEFSPSEAARRLGATTRSVQRWIAQGTLPARRVGGRWRVASDALDAFQDTAHAERQQDLPIGAASQRRRHRGTDDAAPRLIRRLFVANRGEIARRIRRTCDRLGIVAIEPATDGQGAVDLLEIESVVSAARAAAADAVHPGFGFLAENADFATAVEAAGMAWVGPPPDAIRAMGDKAAARRLAIELGVPVVPGIEDPDRPDAALALAAKRIGYPVLIKPAAGGGGKGMRVVRDPKRIADSLASARREAQGAFGDDRLILEKLIEGPRHVEVQVLFDAHGAGVHLGERDCSTQRRHQKVLEETPSPAVNDVIRDKLTTAALKLAGAVGYRSAGTCEFLLDDRGQIFFLEMNTRLQVEHPVTELVTGIDLVEQQIRVAEGRPLDMAQGTIDRALRTGGHAVEVRLYAEDAEHDFLPATGRVERLRWPSGSGVRVDAGIDEGTVVGARFDPMLAKVVAHGEDRGAAFDRLERALDDTVVLGLTTNLRFLRWLVREAAVRRGETRIDSLERIWPPDDWRERSSTPDAAWQAAAQALAPTGWLGGWRLNGPRRVRLASDDDERTIDVGARAAPPLEVVLAGDTAFVDVAGRSVAFRLAPAPDIDRAARAAKSHAGGGAAEIVAPMPGAILAVHAAVGEALNPGDPVATLEAMKMEHAVPTSIGGSVAEVRVRVGDQVARGDVLAVVEP
ncbi:MAG TPA: biotin carboxylase N-terminal domain-containing protein [Candidatus Limnocylindrales bacterium]|nr:biotin carboxylase N-terminal domain-containing protein [Candidatus Limnocylindrales bacterium]